MKRASLTDVLLVCGLLIITLYATFIVTDLASKEAAEYDNRSSAICKILQVETRGSTSKYDILVAHNADTFEWTIYSQIPYWFEVNQSVSCYFGPNFKSVTFEKGFPSIALPIFTAIFFALDIAIVWLLRVMWHSYRSDTKQKTN